MHKRAVNRALLICPVVLGLLVWSAWAQSAGEITVYAIGSSRIVGEDRAAAREDAIRTALVMAVSRTVTETLPIETLTGNFKIVNETVLNRPDQYVRDYKVLSESVAGGTYRLLLQATILVERLKGTVKSAGLTLGKISLPRVLLVAAETIPNDPNPRIAWGGPSTLPSMVTARQLAQNLTDRGFRLVEPEGASVPSLLPSGPAEAMELGRLHEADVVVLSSAGAEQAPGAPGGLTAQRARVRVTAYRTQDGQSLAQVEKSASTGEAAADGSDALRKAAAGAGEELSAKLTEAWIKQASQGNRIEIAVRGVGGRVADFVRFRESLGGISGVENLRLKELASDKTVLAVHFQGSSQALAEAVQQLSFETFQILIVRVDPNSIEMRLAPR